MKIINLFLVAYFLSPVLIFGNTSKSLGKDMESTLLINDLILSRTDSMIVNNKDLFAKKGFSGVEINFLERNSSNHPVVRLKQHFSKLEGFFKSNEVSVSSMGKTLEPRAFIGNPTNDPLFPLSWHLVNSGTNGGKRGEDINVLAAWDQGLSGAGTVIAIIDTAVNVTHPDLKDNYRSDLSYDYVDDDLEPWTDGMNDSHGTTVAGLAVAVDNDIGSVGVAYGAQFASLRLGGGVSTQADAYKALTHKLDEIDIYNISWGYATDHLHFESMPELTKLALERGVNEGRNGLGSIYVVSAGNDRSAGAMTNYFALSSSPYTISVGAVDSLGSYSYYSNPGSTLFVCAPGSGRLVGLPTTDAVGMDGYVGGDYLTDFGGTSAAAPIVSGVIALMLEANPSLGWRDVQHVLANAAFPIDYSNEDWQINGAGLYVNHNYGFGRVDATASVGLSRIWPGVQDLISHEYTNTDVIEIPDYDKTGIQSSIVVEDDIVLENVEITIESDHTDWGDMVITLTSPSGTVSEITRSHADEIKVYGRWTFGTVFNWGESSLGEWTLNVSDVRSDDIGSISSWSLNLTGTEVTEEINHRPIAEEDLFVIPRTGGSVMDILANDEDPDGDLFSPLSFYQPSFGTLNYNDEGDLIYEPGEAFMGADYFGYIITDTGGLTAKTIAAIYDPIPFAVDDQIVTKQNQMVAFDPLLNDYDILDEELVITSVANVSNGAVKILDEGTGLEFVPETDFRGFTQFEYVLTDNVDGQDVGLVNMFVSSMDDFAILYKDKTDYALLGHHEINQPTGFTYEFSIYPFSYGYQDNNLGVVFSNQQMTVYLVNQFGDVGGAATVFLNLYGSDGVSYDYRASFESIRLDTWQHVAITYDTTHGLKLIIDGTESMLTPLDSSQPEIIGRLYVADYTILGNVNSIQFGFHGLIDEFRIWDIARTPEQLVASRNELTEFDLGELSTIICDFKFNEGADKLIDDASHHAFPGLIKGVIWSPKDEDLIQFQRDHFLE